MATISDLVVKITAKTAQFKRDIGKSREVVERLAAAARKGSTVITKGFKAITSAASLAAKAAAGLAAAGAGAFAGFVVKAGKLKDIQTMSTQLGMSAEELQKWGYAARSVGIDTEKIGDIFKDTSDKIGDFLATGGGEAGDLFEKLNLDAREFIGLSPDKALLKLGKAVEPLTQEQKIFFFEAIANDASRLLPLLENNGAEFQRFAKLAVETGNVVSSNGIKAAAEFSKQWDILTSRANGFVSQLTAKLAPVLGRIVTQFDKWVASFGGVESIAQKAAVQIEKMLNFVTNPNTIASAKELFNSIYEGLKLAGTVIGPVVKGLGRIALELKTIRHGANKNSIEELTLQLDKMESALRNKSERIRFFGPGGIVEYWSEDELNAEIAKIKARLAKLVNQDEKGVFNLSGTSDNGDISGQIKAGTNPAKQATNDNTEAVAASTRAANQLRVVLENQRKQEIEKLNARIQGGQDTGAVNWDRITGAGKAAGKSSELFEKAAQRFYKSVQSGAYDPTLAAQGIEHLRTMVERYAGSDQGFDIKGMTATIENLAAVARDTFASPDLKPLTAAEYKAVFEAAQEQARTLEEQQVSHLASIDAQLKKTGANGESKPTQMGTVVIRLQQNGKEIMQEITGDAQSLNEFKRQIERVTEDNRRAATR